jgi:hypothetical protein
MKYLAQYWRFIYEEEVYLANKFGSLKSKWHSKGSMMRVSLCGLDSNSEVYMGAKKIAS